MSRRRIKITAKHRDPEIDRLAFILLEILRERDTAESVPVEGEETELTPTTTPVGDSAEFAA